MSRLRTRLALAAGLTLALGFGGCMDAGRTAGPQEGTGALSSPHSLPTGDGLLGSLTEGLLACTPLPEASASRQLGPDGGSIRVGPHVLVVPPGALGDTVTITAVAPSEPVNSVSFGPHGLVFNARARPVLTMSYDNCPLLGRVLPKRIVYTNDLLQILEILASVDDLLARRVSAPLDHFSRYAVAW